MTVELGVVFGGPNDRLWLPRIRRWVDSNDSLFKKLGLTPVVKPLSSAGEALGWREELPNERVVVAFGLNRGEFESGRVISSGQPIIVQDAASPCGSAAGNRMILARRDVTDQLRKSLVRVAILQRGIEIRSPVTDRELSGYFALRYQVWKAVGYLRDENKGTSVEWEVDYWDRTAVPLCAITREGKTIGCVRLISSLGREEPNYVARIQRLLDQAGEAQLKRLFKFQNAPMHPFDVLCEFPEFGAAYRELLKSGTSVAEIGRVAVDPQYRGQCLSEVLVDSVVALAESRRVKSLFLACHENLGPLYARCGFKPVPGLRSEKFFNIQVPSIVMERRI